MDQAAKQQIVDRVKQAENILVTVSADPSVDQLAACIGLTLMLNKMGKSATAVFSGKIPSTIEFLQPEKTLETTTDSLRDFIISLDKAKADKLRYKVEDQVVRVFITPYKTKLGEKDLTFSEGDFNVEVVIALGVVDRTHIDAAITAHGRILHDASVIALTAGKGKAPDLGQINWQETAASSLSEMLVSISEAFGTGLIDNQIATAFLTGIVAETDRFSNEKTSPKVMTMSAQLMAAGANQQLVISKLEPPPPPPAPIPTPPPPPPKQEPMPPKQPESPAENSESEKSKAKEQSKPESQKEDKGTLNVAHKTSEFDGDEVEIASKEIHIDKQGNLKVLEEEKRAAEAARLAERKFEVPEPVPPPPIPKQEPMLEPKTAPLPLPVPMPPVESPAPIPPPPVAEDSTFHLPPPSPVPEIKQEHKLISPSAPPPSPANPKSRDKTPEPKQEENRHAIMDPLDRAPSMGAAFTAGTGQNGDGYTDYNNVPFDPLNTVGPGGGDSFSENSKKVVQESSSLQNSTNVDSARSAVEQALSGAPFNPAFNPEIRNGADQLGPELHPVAGEETPSLNLPSDTDSPAKGQSPDQTPLPPPPPMPPPIPPIMPTNS